MIRKMKFALTILVFMVSVNASEAMSSDGSYSVSVGFGPLYNGLGVGYRASIAKMNQYFSLGCPGLGYGDGSGWIFRCGVGYSILANLSKSKQHSIGLNFDILYNKTSMESGMEYLSGIFYTYFFNASDSDGWSMQIGPGVSYFHRSFTPITFFGVGYQY